MTTDQAAFLATLAELERLHGYQLDAILPDGTHRYWSTHCRHSRHDDCCSTVLRDDAGNAANRRPAQCKTCAAPCICPCHSGSAVNAEPEDVTHA